MAEVSLKLMRAQMAAAAQAQADGRRSQALSSTGSEEAERAARPSTAETQGARPVINGAALRIDDKLRVAKERREEQEKQQATRESQILQRERKTKQQYERQMEERQRKLEDQRRKEAQRKAAAEEKRKLKQEEEKEHYEAVLRRSAERGQKLDQRQKRWSWGGGLTADSGCGAGSTSVPPSSPGKSRRKESAEVDKHSSPASKLKPQVDPVSKCSSSSSAAITKSSEKSAKQRSSSLNRLPSNGSHPVKDPPKMPQVEQTGPSHQRKSSTPCDGARGRLLPSPKIERKTVKDEQARRLPATPVENSALTRLLTPTKSSLARSKSSAALSAEASDSPDSRLYPRSTSASPLHTARGPLRSHSSDRQKGSSDGSARGTQKIEKEKRFSSPLSKRPASPSSGPSRRRSPSPVAPSSNVNKRPASPAASKQSPRNRPPSPCSAKQRPPSPQSGSRPPPIQRPALTPAGPPTLRRRDSKGKEVSAGQPLVPQHAETPPPSSASNSKSKDDSSGKVGTASAEAAAKILAENRRLAREQKEKDELLRAQKEEEERLRKEEEERLAEEQRLLRAEEEKKRAEERKLLEAQQAQQAEEERVRSEIEEQEKQAELQREREEAEARAQEEAEKQRLERERIMQQNRQERMERKKRIEEIMKRTRRTDQNDFKRDDEKGMFDENEEEDGEFKDDLKDEGCENEEAESEAGGWSQPHEGPMAEMGEGLLGKFEMDNKENRSVLNTRDSESVSPVPKELLVEDSNIGPMLGLNGGVGSWSLEELIDLGIPPKAGPLISTDGVPEKPRVAFEDKGSAVGSLHPGQPMEALSKI